MLTKSQREFVAKSFAAVAAVLSAIPYQTDEAGRDLPTRLLSKCPTSYPEARAFYWVAYYLGKPSRIPSDFGSLLGMDEGMALAAAIVSRFGPQLHAVIDGRAIERMNKIELNHTR